MSTTSSSAITATSNITLPAPILTSDSSTASYPKAPTMSTSTTSTATTISSPTLQYQIQTAPQQTSLEGTETKECIILTTNNKTMYYYQEPITVLLQQDAQEAQPETSLFYNQHKKPIWKLTNRDWHGMTLVYQNNKITLSTTPPPYFKFTWNSEIYHWQATRHSIQQYTLKCFETETKKLIAQLDQNQILLDILPVVSVVQAEENNTNPFRKSAVPTTAANNEDDPFTTFVILSGLLVNHHIKILLKSLGGGPEALQMILDPLAANKSPIEEEHDDDDDADIASLSSNAYTRHHYPGHQSLVEGNRWSSSAQSFKSIELDPGVWHCWWGYRFWWSWFPCCMPGGYCDRACIRLKGGHKPKSGRTTRILSKQGRWQQQHY